jgi:glycosyltransferase involved in cell wall biosynthesis
MVKIVHFGKYYAPVTGGIESVTSSLAKGVAEVGQQVSVVCFDKVSKDAMEILDGVRVVRAPIWKTVASQPLGWRYIVACCKEARNADIVHLHAPNMLAALCALLLSRKVRLLVHWHSDVINKGLLGALLMPLEKALLKRADCIVATSQPYAEASATLQAFREKVTVVPLGVAPVRKGQEIATGCTALTPELETLIGKRKVILAVGRLVPYKGFDVLIEAARHLREDALVVVVGGGPLEASLRQKIADSGVGGRVHMTGRASDNVLHALFTRASMYCMPSLYRAEAFGVVLLEAMAHGLPVVAADIPGSGVPWVNQHGVSGLNVPVGDPVALAQACNRILGSEQEHARFSTGASKRFTEEFTEEVSVKKIIATYDRLAV